jgi:hypothetical protein
MSIATHHTFSNPASARTAQAPLPARPCSAHLVRPQGFVTAVFAPDGRKVAFVSESLLSPAACHALLEWGDRKTWTSNPALARKWHVKLVLADPHWAGSQHALDGDDPPEGLRIAFL